MGEILVDLERLERVHFIGIGGIGTSGVARILLGEGKRVTGSDLGDNLLLEQMRRDGARILIGHRADNLPEDAQVVIISAAIPHDNPEILAAQALSIPIITYSQALGSLMRRRFGIAVAGTHGKTSTSAMVAVILKTAGLDPSFVIGGEIPLLGGNSGTGQGRYLVAEACEFRRNFLSLRPRVALVTNIEEDHLDYYKDIEEIEEAFLQFLSRLPTDGFAVVCRESANVQEVVSSLDRPVYTYGFSGADFRAESMELRPDSSAYRAFYREECLGTVTIAVPGIHNILNSLGAFATCRLLGLEPEMIIRGLAAFRGVNRRLEKKGIYRGAVVLDDYGHHPTEIVATLAAIRQFYPAGRLLVVFQPHQYSRTRFFLEDFARSFRLADEVIVPEIYFVRDSEESRRSVSAADLVERLRANGKKAGFFDSFARVVDYLRENLVAGDVLLTLGAGPVHQVGEELLQSEP
ncbi:MAG TPA: UDP-N-acetylmuramate--L-alanine ligase [bacterium]|uniref:UDP-N-acetylmuramate--L-alanine ligase n=1 Tax=candidate division TA06 bacterium ADurb.Bin417 TaxID=1852828 RepID=A0A1V5MHD5_UNCT6|nr:MAG: UDP-N-acetylmuramate--L-alanine ligase [candidate division TA06 bacterium ADurb.Bin417]HNQ34659.1 UDP-N-acetylmuramate--L-alanine ligase [bacterium]HNS48917.1 UDP-N-acetylmuramate--L-alanine ligase [bacterium]